MMLEQAVNEVVVFFEWHQLKRGNAVYGDDHGLVMA
jgi:hypothetical protein